MSEQSAEVRPVDIGDQMTTSSSATDDIAANVIDGPSDGAGNDGDTPLTFADVIRGISTPSITDQTGVGAASAKPGFGLTVKRKETGSDLQLSQGLSVLSVDKPGSRRATTKILTAGTTTLPAGIDQDKTPALPAPSRDKQSGPQMVVVAPDVVASPLLLRPKPAEETEFAGGARTQLQAQPESQAVFQAEPAVTVAIRTTESLSIGLQADPAANTVLAQIGVDLTIAAEGPAPASHLPSAKPSDKQDAPSNVTDSDLSIAPAKAAEQSDIAGMVAPISHATATRFLSPDSDTGRKKAAEGTSAMISDASASAKVAASPAAQPEQAPVDTQTPGAAAQVAPRSDGPHAPVAPAEAPAEQHALQPLRSLALEFTPDGAKDVRVRLLERSGEVHVSLHSNDPGITRNLRDGVADLANVLSQSGYDAEAWTSGGRQQGNQQQRRDEPGPQRTQSSSNTEAENFDGVLQHPVQEIS